MIHLQSSFDLGGVSQKLPDSFFTVRMDNHAFQEIGNDRDKMGTGIEPFDDIQHFTRGTNDNFCFQIEIIQDITQLG